MGELERDSIEIGGEDRRIYFDRDSQRMGLSVSTVTDIRDNPEKKKALDGWRSTYDGSDEDSYPHHVEQMVYKQLRGTLGHYAILSNLGNVPKGEEEYHAEKVLKNWDTERPSAQRDDVTHIGDDHSYDGEQAWSKCMRDISWVTSEFVDIAAELGINPDSVIATENYVSYDDPLYRGQFDLLYTDKDGVNTLCDLKLASGIRYDYKLQIAAYRNAILNTEGYPDSIPRVQIIRLHPDKEHIEIQTNDGVGAFIDGEARVDTIKQAKKDGRLISTEINNMDAVDDHWRFDAKLELPPWNSSLDELTAEFLALVEEASEEWLSNISWEQFITSVDENVPLSEIDTDGNY